jgi:SAM-dependent methyltransferase
MLSQSLVTSDLKQFIANHPEKIRNVFTSFHASHEPLNDHCLDSLLGIQSDSTETTINRQDLDHFYGIEQYKYEGTPYEFIRWFLHVLDPSNKDIVYDLGSGYGRVPLYGALTTQATYKGIEIVPERIAEARAIKRRFAINNVEFLQGNVIDFDYSDGTIFFFFNPFIESTLKLVIESLQKTARKRRIIIVSWNGLTTDQFCFLPWLHQLTLESEDGSPLHPKIRIFESV